MRTIQQAGLELPSHAEMSASDDQAPAAGDNWSVSTNRVRCSGVEANDVLSRSGASRAGSPSQITPEHVLNPLAIYRMARKDIRDGQKDGANASLHVPPVSVFSPTDESTVSAIRTPEFAGIDVPDQRTMTTGANYLNGAFPDTVDLPTSFDDLQMYMCLPPTYGGYSGSLPFDMAAAGSSYPDYSNAGPGLNQPPHHDLRTVPEPSSTAGYPFQASQDNLWTG